MTSAIRAQRESEEGFTLIELLVVVIIIGILAAIAIPAFLNQRERAWQAELTSAVRNGALEAEAAATAANGDYTGVHTAAGTYITSQVNGGTAPASGVTPIDLFTGVSDAGGFKICAEHGQIADAHSVKYFGGDQGNGLQNFAATACGTLTLS